MKSSESIRFADVTGLLYPKSVAVIGASDRSGNFGGDTIERLLRFKFPGPVYAVNPNGGTARGLPCYKSVKELPEVPESVILAIPGAAIIDAVRECGMLGVRNGVAFAGGFAEGGGEGIELQRRLVETCHEFDFKLCGPNCAGILNAATPVTSTFATSLHEIHTLIKGPVSVVTQSGGIGTTTFFSLQEKGFGCRHLISAGNEAVVSLADYLYGLAHDDGTEIIAAYIEGIRNAPKLVRALEEARNCGKPVVLIKSGVTSASARAAKAHTGALVGEDRVFDAILQELGVIRVSSVEEMADVCMALTGSRGRVPKGNGIGVVTFGGGNGVLAADQAAKHGLTVPALDAEHAARVKPMLISVASAANPMDLTPTTAFRVENLERLPHAMHAMAAQPDIQSMLVIAGQMHARKNEIFEVFSKFARECEKTVCLSWPTPPSGITARFAERGIPLFDDFDRGLRVLGRMAAFGMMASRPRRPENLAPLPFDWAKFVAAGEAVVSEDRCHAIMRAAGLPAAPGELAKTEADALRIAQEVGLPVAMKGITPKVTHRAAAGLLAVDMRTPQEVAEAFLRLQARASEIKVALDGVYVQKMARGGVELLVSVFRDPMFGTMISCGSGGGMTEQLDDVVTSRAPVDETVAADMLSRTRLMRYARDERGPLDTAAAASFIARLSRLGASAPWPSFTFEVNPVKWSRTGVVAVDGLLVLETV